MSDVTGRTGGVVLARAGGSTCPRHFHSRGGELMKLRLLVLASALASLFIIGPIAETSAAPSYTSVITIRATNPVFHGRVHLFRAGHHPKVARPCRTHRRVTLFRHHQSTTQRIGRDRTNRLGRWSISTTPHQGRYF